ncbi:hypothetical protein AAG906_021135 [Vitis piasezkii]
MDTQQSRHAAVIPPIVTTVTVIEDPCSRIDRLKQRIRRMRDPDETISWDDTDDMLVATLPISFRMLEIKRYTGHNIEMVHFIRVISSKNLGGLNIGPVSSFISHWREKTAEMIKPLTERDQMCMFFRILPPRGKELLDHLKVMEAYVLQAFNIDDLVIILTLDHCKYLRVISHPHSIIILSQFSNILLCILILPHTIGPQAAPSTLPPCFRAHEFCAFHQMASHCIDYCASLRHTIQDLIDSGVVSFLVSTTDTDLGLDMTTDSFLAYSTHAIHHPSRVLDSLSTVTGSQAEINGMMVMMDLTQRIERIKIILLEYPSSLRGAPGVVMPSLPHLISPASQYSSPITLATLTRPLSQLQDPPVIILPQERLHPR